VHEVFPLVSRVVSLSFDVLIDVYSLSSDADVDMDVFQDASPAQESVSACIPIRGSTSDPEDYEMGDVESAAEEEAGPSVQTYSSLADVSSMEDGESASEGGLSAQNLARVLLSRGGKAAFMDVAAAKEKLRKRKVVE
jgi:hypothetical protein